MQKLLVMNDLMSNKYLMMMCFTIGTANVVSCYLSLLHGILLLISISVAKKGVVLNLFFFCLF